MRYFPFCYSLLLTLSACQLDSGMVECEDGTTPGPQAPATIRDLQIQLGAQQQPFTYQPDRSNTITGSQGTVVVIPAGAFLKNGQPVTTPVPLTLREIYDRTAMVLSNTPTVTRGQVLESAGAVYLRAAPDSSSQLTLAPGAVIRIQTTNPPNLTRRDSMELFVAPAVPAGCFSWSSNFDRRSGLVPNVNGYTLTIGSQLYNNGIGWFNCDRFYGAPAPLPLTVNVSGTAIDPVANTLVFAVFREFNGSLAICNFTPPNVFQASGAPSGARISVVVIRTVDQKLYYGRQDGTVQPGIAFNPVLREVTEAELVADLDSL